MGDTGFVLVQSAPPKEKACFRRSPALLLISSSDHGDDGNDFLSRNEKLLQESTALSVSTGNSWKQFKYGFLFVHENYLDICSSLAAAVLPASLGFGVLLLSLVGTQEGLSVLQSLVQASLITSTMTSLLSFMCILPYYLSLMAILPPLVFAKVVLLHPSISSMRKFKDKILAFYRAMFSVLKEHFKMAIGQSNQDKLPIPKMEAMGSLSALAEFLVFAPILEEIIFLQGLLAMRKAMGSTGKKNRDGDVPPAQMFGYPYWVFISSLLFAALHISQWVNPLDGLSMAETPNQIVVANCLSYAFANFTVTLFMSLKVFSPLFEGHGPMASIGAHVSWNLNVLHMHVWLPARIVFRSFRKMRQKIRQKKRNQTIASVE